MLVVRRVTLPGVGVLRPAIARFAGAQEPEA
jgi:hypothetical protein